MNKFLTALVAITIIILLATLGYFIFQNQKLIGQLSKNPAGTTSPAPTSSPAPTPTPQISPSPEFTEAITQNAIKTNVVAKNYQGLIAYMADPVSVFLRSTECCGPQTSQEATDQMSSYTGQAQAFNFNQDSELAKNLKTKNPELEDHFIGISTTTEHTIAFGLNNQNKISSIWMSVSWKLFNY